MLHRSFSTDTSTTEIYTLSLHDALPISPEPSSSTFIIPKVFNPRMSPLFRIPRRSPGIFSLRSGSVGLIYAALTETRSEEHTSELQSQSNLVCRLLLEKKKNDHSVLVHL